MSMTVEKTYALLEMPRRYARKIWRAEIRRDALRSCLTQQAVVYDGDRVQVSPKDKTAELVAEIADIGRDIDQMKRRRAELLRYLRMQIAKMDSTDQDILVGYYFGNMSIKQLAEDVGYHPKYLPVLKRKAVRRLAAIL